MQMAACICRLEAGAATTMARLGLAIVGGRCKTISFSLVIASARRFVGLVLSRSSGRRLEGGLGTARCRGSDVLRRYGPTAAVGDRRERATLFRHTAHKAEASVVEV